MIHWCWDVERDWLTDGPKTLYPLSLATCCRGRMCSLSLLGFQTLVTIKQTYGYQVHYWFQFIVNKIVWTCTKSCRKIVSVLHVPGTRLHCNVLEIVLAQYSSTVTPGTTVYRRTAFWEWRHDVRIYRTRTSPSIPGVHILRIRPPQRRR